MRQALGKVLHRLSDRLHLLAHWVIGDEDWRARNGPDVQRRLRGLRDHFNDVTTQPGRFDPRTGDYLDQYQAGYVEAMRVAAHNVETVLEELDR